MILRSSPYWPLLLTTLVALALQPGLVATDADWESVRIRYDYPYMGGRGGDPKDKYWRRSCRPPLMLYVANTQVISRRIDVGPSTILQRQDQSIFNQNRSFHPHYDGRYEKLPATSTHTNSVDGVQIYRSHVALRRAEGKPYTPHAIISRINGRPRCGNMDNTRDIVRLVVEPQSTTSDR